MNLLDWLVTLNCVVWVGMLWILSAGFEKGGRGFIPALSVFVLGPFVVMLVVIPGVFQASAAAKVMSILLTIGIGYGWTQQHRRR